MVCTGYPHYTLKTKRFLMKEQLKLQNEGKIESAELTIGLFMCLLNRFFMNLLFLILFEAVPRVWNANCCSMRNNERY